MVQRKKSFGKKKTDRSIKKIPLLATNLTFLANTTNTGQTAPVTRSPTPARILILNSQGNNLTQTNQPKEKTNIQKTKPKQQKPTKQKTTNSNKKTKKKPPKTTKPKYKQRGKDGKKEKEENLNQIISHIYTLNKV